MVSLLHEDSTDEVLKPRINGKYQKCVVIPESVVSKDVMDSLYEDDILNGIHDFNMSPFVLSKALHDYSC